MKSTNMESKIVQILTWLKEGKTKEEITSHFHYKSWKSVDMYFRRRGFKWNGQTYYIPNSSEASKQRDAVIHHQKTKQILKQLELKYVNIEEVAIKNGFPTTEELGEYMKNEGYLWNSSEQRYLYHKITAQQSVPIPKTTMPSPVIDEDLLVFLAKHKTEIIEMIEAYIKAKSTSSEHPFPIQ